jgi:hypothetical protein
VFIVIIFFIQIVQIKNKYDKKKIFNSDYIFKKLQEQDLLLFDSIQIINDVEKSFETLRGQIGLKIKSKLKNISRMLSVSLGVWLGYWRH